MVGLSRPNWDKICITDIVLKQSQCKSLFKINLNKKKIFFNFLINWSWTLECKYTYFVIFLHLYWYACSFSIPSCWLETCSLCMLLLLLTTYCLVNSLYCKYAKISYSGLILEYDFSLLLASLYVCIAIYMSSLARTLTVTTSILLTGFRSHIWASQWSHAW